MAHVVLDRRNVADGLGQRLSPAGRSEHVVPHAPETNEETNPRTPEREHPDSDGESTSARTTETTHGNQSNRTAGGEGRKRGQGGDFIRHKPSPPARLETLSWADG